MAGRATPTASSKGRTQVIGRWYVDARASASEYQRSTKDLGASASAAPRSSDGEALAVLLTAAVCLTALNFGATTQPHWFVNSVDAVGLDRLAGALDVAFFDSDNRRFNGLVFWATAQIMSYLVLPAVLIRVVFKRSLTHYGLALRLPGTDAAPYLFLLVIAAPFVVAASSTQAFQDKYPFYDLAAGQGLWPYMYLWWLLYAGQFVALEFFFRGFLIHGLVRATGMLAVPIMVVPYTMLHFDKPLVEAFAAIIGGLVLGTLALKIRTVWWGALLHISVAMMMDLLAIGWSRW